MKTLSEAVDVGGVSTAEALEIFDGLDPVDLSFMLGSWKGRTFPTSHPLDGVLEAYHWHGKRFEDAEHAHPLVFKTVGGDSVNVNPLWTMPVINLLNRLPISKSKPFGPIFHRGLSLVTTKRSCARLRLTNYRGKESATMIYDVLPINDIFRKINGDTMLGIMDLKGMKQPFFFMLQRE